MPPSRAWPKASVAGRRSAPVSPSQRARAAESRPRRRRRSRSPARAGGGAQVRADLLDVERALRHEDRVRAPRDAGVGRDPAGVTAHDLEDHHAVGDSAVVCRRSIASVTICTAVWKPNVTSVPPRSLSIVFGTPTTGMPASCRRSGDAERVLAADRDQRVDAARAQRRADRVGPSLPSAKGFVREVPRIVPPRGRMPRCCQRQLDRLVAEQPAQPWRKPTKLWPLGSPLRTTPRITAFRPGQSPPPVNRPMRATRSRLGARGPTTRSDGRGHRPSAKGEIHRPPAKGENTDHPRRARTAHLREWETPGCDERVRIESASSLDPVPTEGRALAVRTDTTCTRRPPWRPGGGVRAAEYRPRRSRTGYPWQLEHAALIVVIVVSLLVGALLGFILAEAARGAPGKPRREGSAERSG